MLTELCVFIIILNCFHKNVNINFMCTAHSKLESEIKGIRKTHKNHYRYLMRPFLEDEESWYLNKMLNKGIKQNNQNVNIETQIVDYISKKKIGKPGRKSAKRRSKTSKVKKKKLDAESMIVSEGYGVESHIIYTDDGYILTIFRILPGSGPGKKHNSKFRSKQRVILHHGLLGSCEDWLILRQEHALPYLLSDNGFDVWLLNARGNKYGREHRSNYIESNTFWRFSWHEMGTYDLPAVLKYIKKSTYKADTHFIGHSMGATALLVLLSTRLEYNRKLKSAILLAPLAFMYNVQGPLKRLSEFHSHTNLSYIIDLNEFWPDGIFPQILNESFCRGQITLICSNSLLLIADGGKDIYDEELKNSILSHVPAGTSTQTIIHYIQLLKSGSFRMFDFGKVNNFKRYYLEEPPDYDLEKITLPISLISSSSDRLATEPDITTLVTKLENVKIHHILKSDDFDHMDFVWSKSARTLVFDPVIEILQRKIR